MVPVPNQDVTKNLTGCRIHVEGTQLSQIYRQINSFQDMHNMLKAKIDRLARKLVFVQTNTSKLPIFVCTNLGCLTLEGPRRQTVDTRSGVGLVLGLGWGVTA